jgi:hypothetical protein
MPDAFNWNDRVIKRCESDVHLGNIIGGRGSEQIGKGAMSDFYRRFNHMLCNFQYVQADVKYHLFKSICMSVYGSQLWDYSSRVCDQFFTAWRKAVRRLCKLSQRTHNHLLPLIVNTQLHKRLIIYYYFFFS